MNVERIASLHVTTGEEDLAFLKQKVIGGRSSDRSVARASDGLLYNLAFEDAATNPCEIDAKERPFIRQHPTFYEVVAFVVSPKVELAES
jgi:hypothetical protein